MKVKTVKVSDKGQISIPADIRETIGIKKGDDLLVVQKGERIMLTKISDFFRKLDPEFPDMAFHAQESLKGVWDNDEDEVWNDL
ncbi:hypothetical protein A3K63_04205 [Candidatus Micrarchaeota archaeon RBG_16_49_10]|nr:MAG: hypothetical protein A3K63_04205 [Candidatus Micrarchaeota archaeon RBG_16_49_10]